MLGGGSNTVAKGTMLFTAEKDEPVAPAPEFDDVDAYADAVSWAVEKKVTNGSNAAGTTFSPDTVCTRAHIAKFLFQAY